MIYAIDSSNVNARTDWTHTQIAGPPQSLREEQFPGIARRFAVVGPALPPDMQIDGFLEATETTLTAARFALLNLGVTYTTMLAHTALHTIGLDSHTIGSCRLIAFGWTKPVQRVQTTSNIKLRRACRFLWRQMSW